MPNDPSPIEPESSETPHRNDNDPPGPDRPIRIMDPDSEAPNAEIPEPGEEPSLPKFAEMPPPPAFVNLSDYERMRAVNAWQRAGAILDAVERLNTYTLQAVPFVVVRHDGTKEFIPAHRNEQEEIRIAWDIINNINRLAWIGIKSPSFTGRTAIEVRKHFDPDALFGLFARAMEWQEALLKDLPEVIKGECRTFWHRDQRRVDETRQRLGLLWFELDQFRYRLAEHPESMFAPPADDVPFSPPRPVDARPAPSPVEPLPVLVTGGCPYIVFQGHEEELIVRGKPAPRTTYPQYCLIQALAEAHPMGLSLEDLKRRSGVANPPNMIDTLRKREPWKSVLVKPGKPHGRYGLADR